MLIEQTKVDLVRKKQSGIKDEKMVMGVFSGRIARHKPLITAVEVAGFKSAALPVRVKLRDITILAGANSSGKSTVMQPLLMIKQTMEKPFDPGGLAIDGPLVKFTHTDQFFSKMKLKALVAEFRLSVEQNTKKLKYYM